MPKKTAKNPRGAGRKPKAQEDKIRGFAVAAMAEVYGSEQAGWLYLAEKAKDSFPHMKMLWEYTYGKPRETKDINLTAEQPLFPDL
jgi:hypothetical protein